MLKLLVPHRLVLLGAGALVAVLGLALGWSLPSGSALAQQPTETGAMSLSVDGAGVDCSGDECIVDKGSDFTLTIAITQAPASGYIGLSTEVQYQNLIYSPTEDREDEILIAVDNFPGISVRAVNDEGAWVRHGMTGGNPPQFTTSHYEGPIVELAMTCTEDYSRNDVTLPPYAEGAGSGFKLPVSAGNTNVPASDAVTIHCGPPPTPTPGPTATTAPQLPTTGTGGTASNDATIWFVLGGLLAAAATASVGVLSWKQARR